MNTDISKWKEMLLEEVSYKESPGGMNFYLIVFNESLARRFILILEECFNSYFNKAYICSYMNLRALIETVALSVHLKKMIDENTKIHVNQLKRIAFGGRLDEFEIKQTSIQTILNKMFRDSPALENSYNKLCEFTHPNYMGVIESFSDFNPCEDLAHLVNCKECINRGDYFSLLESISSYMRTLHRDISTALKENPIAKAVGFEAEPTRQLNICLTVENAEFLKSEIEVCLEKGASEKQKKWKSIKKSVESALKK